MSKRGRQGGRGIKARGNEREREAAGRAKVQLGKKRKRRSRNRQIEGKREGIILEP